VLAGPLDKLAAYIFREASHAYHRRFSVPRYDSVQAAHEPRRWRLEVHIICQTFAVKVVDDIQRAVRFPVPQLIRLKNP
jgi:hypothetical protein